MAELVSIVMATYNGCAHIREAIQSCIDQTHAEWELLVVDDASTDETADVVTSIDDPRVRLIGLRENRGPGESRNVALDTARGDWVTVLDDDDLYRADRLANLLRHAESAGHSAVILDELLRWDPLTERLPSATSRPRKKDEPSSRMAAHEWFSSGHFGQPFFHRSAISDDRVRYPDLRFGEDTTFVIRMLQYNQMHIVQTSDFDYIYRMRAGSLSSYGTRSRAESQHNLRLLLDEFAESEALASAIQHELSSSEAVSKVVEFRDALHERQIADAVGMLHDRYLRAKLLRVGLSIARSRLQGRRAAAQGPG